MSSIPQKRCTKCGVEKPFLDFHKDKAKPDGFAPHCKVCVKERTKQWRAENADAKRAYQQSYNAEHREYYRAYAESDRRETDRFRCWQKLNPEKNAAHSRRYNHRRRSNGGDYTEAEWVALCEQHNYCCACCGDQVHLTVDHVIPVSRGGSNAIDNIQPLCRSCNSRKGAKSTDYRDTATR